jgi:ABC-2 type transport system permease protein
VGGYFVAILAQANQQAAFGGGTAPDISPINGFFAFLLVMLIPALTMRLLADETRSGTIELLLTAPLRDHELVIGKWLGGFLFVLMLITVTLIYPLILNNLVTPGIDQMMMLTSYLGLILIAASLLALGTGISALFTNQIAAFFISLFLFIGLWWFFGLPSYFIQGGAGNIFSYLIINTHFGDSLNVGTINVSDLVYFFSLIAIGLFTGTAAIEIRRWR